MSPRAPRASAVATRERLLAVGLELFHARGYHAVGIQEVVDAAGIPKGSFYNHFRSKQELAITALQQYAAHSPVDLLWSTPEGPRAGIRAHFEELERRFVDADLMRGCMLGNFANEIADRDETVRNLLTGLFEAWAEVLTDALRQAETSESVRLAMPADQLAGVILSLWEGAITRARAAQSEEPLRQFFDVVFGDLIPDPSVDDATATTPVDRDNR
ncbi:TetR family transcriptional regulator C-terminal domain-containing protein [[Mycobacterium] kokjensenii]|uniref:TetR family transcriptional regulator C-terminal domain-containing protein n=1 Tax=[Mycobacterium] kokjensenii TaxID=3064287 RepID=A0ABM9L848_9MYCO|nr:TetR/AcrR family transcriptional regulator [Mycolicibacter sp. MU0083]CAJ1494368.1 TetR family transcriptional regulator C-terminal domain-containing protein [Mycolicibacter sp. MU0083]